MKKIAIVTGGTKGLGLIIARELVNNGYCVYAPSRKPEKNIDGILPISSDISNEADCKKAISYVISKERRLDLIVNNAGVIFTNKALDADEQSLLEVFKVNVFGAYYLIKHSFTYLKKTKGKIINITSLNGLVPVPNASVYSSSKHALEALGISLSYEFERDGVFVTNIAPGAIYNPGAQKLFHKTMREKFPILKILFPMITREIVAKKVVEIAHADHPPKRVVVGVDAQVAFFISRTFPSLWFVLFGKMYSK